MADPQVWPIEPNGADEIIEEYGYDTDILRAKNGSEQRVQLRIHPTLRLEVTCLLELFESGLAQSLVYGHLPKSWIVPLWMHARPLQVSLSPTDTNVQVLTDDAPWRDPEGLGDQVLLWKDSQTYEVATLTAVGGSLTVLPVAGTWAAGSTYVIPARMGRLEGEVAVRWLNNRVLEGTLRWRCDDHEKNPPGAGGGSDFIIIDEQVIPTS